MLNKIPAWLLWVATLALAVFICWLLPKSTPTSEPETPVATSQELKVRIAADGQVECLPHPPHRR